MKTVIAVFVGRDLAPGAVQENRIATYMTESATEAAQEFAASEGPKWAIVCIVDGLVDCETGMNIGETIPCANILTTTAR